jgi:hypothetical protein
MISIGSFDENLKLKETELETGKCSVSRMETEIK